eukprot:scaffold10467_cov88-Isochrysis_galbana.AAC.3
MCLNNTRRHWARHRRRRLSSHPLGSRPASPQHHTTGPRVLRPQIDAVVVQNRKGRSKNTLRRHTAVGGPAHAHKQDLLPTGIGWPVLPTGIGAGPLDLAAPPRPRNGSLGARYPHQRPAPEIVERRFDLPGAPGPATDIAAAFARTGARTAAACAILHHLRPPTAMRSADARVRRAPAASPTAPSARADARPRTLAYSQHRRVCGHIAATRHRMNPERSPQPVHTPSPRRNQATLTHLS